MPNEFDDLETSLHNDVAETFGYSASWFPASGGPVQVITALFQDPDSRGGTTETQYLNYEDVQPVMEYYEGQFPGLFESVQKTNQVERIEVTRKGTVFQYQVTRVRKVIDGDTYVANLVFITSRPA